MVTRPGFFASSWLRIRWNACPRGTARRGETAVAASTPLELQLGLAHRPSGTERGQKPEKSLMWKCFRKKQPPQTSPKPPMATTAFGDDAGEPQGGCDGACGSQEEKAVISWGSALSGGSEPLPRERGRVRGQGCCSSARRCISPCPTRRGCDPTLGGASPGSGGVSPLSPQNVPGLGCRGAALDPKDEEGGDAGHRRHPFPSSAPRRLRSPLTRVSKTSPLLIPAVTKAR